METVFLANLYHDDGSAEFVGVFSTADKAKEELRTHSASTLHFDEYTVKTSGRKFWSAEPGDLIEYSVKEEWVQ